MKLELCGAELKGAGEAGQAFDLHTHTAFSDGADSAEDMVRSALDRGLFCIGLSDHSHVSWDDCGMTGENTEAYREEAGRLKRAYDGRIRVLCGLERDYYSDDFRTYDYVIGSVHWMEMPDGHHLSVDWTPEKLQRDTEKYFGGDWYAMAEAYYALEADVVRRTRCDIIGHFDLVAKFNEGNRFFREDDPRYTAAWQRAADALLETGKPFEINTGALARGYRTDPYPARPIRAYLRERGAALLLSSDAHRKENLCYGFQNFGG